MLQPVPDYSRSLEETLSGPLSILQTLYGGLKTCIHYMINTLVLYDKRGKKD